MSQDHSPDHDSKQESKDNKDVITNPELKKIESDLNSLVKKNVELRVLSQKYGIARRLHSADPTLNDEILEKVVDLKTNELSNALSNISPFSDSDKKQLIALDSDDAKSKIKYPNPVFSTKTWKIQSKLDGWLFWEILFLMLFLPIYLWAQTLYILIYAGIRSVLPNSSTTRYYLKQAFITKDSKTTKLKVNAKLHSHLQLSNNLNHNDNTTSNGPTTFPDSNFDGVSNNSNEKKSKKQISDTRSDGSAGDDGNKSGNITSFLGTNKKGKTRCMDVWCCCCVAGIKINEYMKALYDKKIFKNEQNISLRIGQLNKYSNNNGSNNKGDSKDDDEKGNNNDKKDDKKDKKENRKEVLRPWEMERKESFFDQFACCCICPLAKDMVPLIESENIHWTPGWYHGCTPFDLQGCCFATKKQYDTRLEQLNLTGTLNSHLPAFWNWNFHGKWSNIIFRIIVCILVSIGYAFLWINFIGCFAYLEYDYIVFEFLELSNSAVESDCVIEGFVPIIIYVFIAFLIATWTAFRKKLMLPNAQKLESFTLKWQNFDNVTNATEAMLQVSEKNARSRLLQTHSQLDHLNSSKNNSINAFSFLRKRQQVFISRIENRLKADPCLRFRHDMDFNAGLRGIVGIILILLPGLVRLASNEKFFMFHWSYVMTSMLNHLFCLLFFSSFVQYEVFQTDYLDLYSFWMQDITAILQWPTKAVNIAKMKRKLQSIETGFGKNKGKTTDTAVTTTTAAKEKKNEEDNNKQQQQQQGSAYVTLTETKSVEMEMVESKNDSSEAPNALTVNTSSKDNDTQDDNSTAKKQQTDVWVPLGDTDITISSSDDDGSDSDSDIDDDNERGWISDADINSLPYLNIMEHGNALAWVEIRSYLQGCIKVMLSKVDMLLALIYILLLLDLALMIYAIIFEINDSEFRIFIVGLIEGICLAIFIGLLNIYPLLQHAPKLRKLQSLQLSSLLKQKLVAANVVNNKKYWKSFSSKDKVWNNYMSFGDDLAIAMVDDIADVVKDGDFSATVFGYKFEDLSQTAIYGLGSTVLPSVVYSLFSDDS